MLTVPRTLPILCALLIMGCGGGGGGGGDAPAPPPEPTPPPPPPPPPTGSPPAATEADGRWLADSSSVSGYAEGFLVYMFDGLVIMSGNRSPSSRLASGVYQISGNDITAQLTRTVATFPISGFSGFVETDDDGRKMLDVTLTTREGDVDEEFRFRSDGSITQDELTRVWTDRSANPPNFTVTLDENGGLFYQGTDGCAASGSFSIPRTDINLFTLAFEMQGCPLSARNGTYRSIGTRSPFRDTDLHAVSTNDTNPDQFLSWWVTNVPR